MKQKASERHKQVRNRIAVLISRLIDDQLLITLLSADMIDLLSFFALPFPSRGVREIDVQEKVLALCVAFKIQLCYHQCTIY